eukprot:m.143217 g.143217  ORF g.143217 m.143217 type:complete len:84 (+) comp14981_c0_seq13:235-486(+)
MHHRRQLEQRRSDPSRAANCPDLTIANGSVVYSGTPKANPVTATVTCTGNLYVLSGSPTLLCRTDGTWNDTTTCVLCELLVID